MWQHIETLSSDPSQLKSARLLAHWAGQIPAAVATALLPAQADFSQANLGWHSDSGALVTRVLHEGTQLRLALVIETLELRIEQATMTLEGLNLQGHSLGEALAWVHERLGATLVRELPPFELPKHDMPEHPLAKGAKFDATTARAELIQLSHWLGAAHESLQALVEDQAQAGELRLWPHHFDLATLLTLRAHDDPEQAQTIGVGLSPGDSSYNEPYFYLSPWPYPDKATAVEELALGHWHREGFFAAVLTGSQLLEVAADTRQHRAEAFVHGALQACRSLLART